MAPTSAGGRVPEWARWHVSASDRFDRVVWMGDWNARVRAPRGKVDGWIAEGAVEQLRAHDELLAAMSRGQTARGFGEGPLLFRPTYKFDTGTDVYDSGPKRRVPSWTDRILVKPPTAAVRVLSYASVERVTYSDHRPVVAALALALQGRPGPPAPRATWRRPGAAECSPPARRLSGCRSPPRAAPRPSARACPPTRRRPPPPNDATTRTRTARRTRRARAAQVSARPPPRRLRLRLRLRPRPAPPPKKPYYPRRTTRGPSSTWATGSWSRCPSAPSRPRRRTSRTTTPRGGPSMSARAGSDTPSPRYACSPSRPLCLALPLSSCLPCRGGSFVVCVLLSLLLLKPF
jgi:hypothetical protein